MGELANGYKIAPALIEEEDLRYLNHFLETFASDRLREHWKEKCNRSGRVLVMYWSPP